LGLRQLMLALSFCAKLKSGSTMEKIQTKQKLRPNNKSTYDVIVERDSNRARLLNYSTGDKVEMIWNMNEAAEKDGIFILKVGDREVMLRAEEFRRYLRWVR